MRLETYLDRIAYRGDTQPSLGTLSCLLQAHVTTVPFENLDVQLGRRLTTAPSEAYDKIVKNRRGGWCYEQNGLFGWALGQLGFEVMRVAAAVMRQERGDVSTANHLCLLAGIPNQATRYLVDVGFGGSLWQPIEFAESEYHHTPYRLGLRQLDSNQWRFYEDHGSGEFSYDFEPVAADEAALSAKCSFLQTHPESSFVLNLVAQVRRPDSHIALRGRVLSTTTQDGTTTRTLSSADEMIETLGSVFDLDVPEMASVWPRILDRHETLFGEDA